MLSAARLLREKEERGRSASSKFSESHMRRMCLTHELFKHTGCVNTVEWHPQGHFLASGSDDTKICLWDVGRNYHLAKKIDTSHEANIFCVRFLPGSDLIASCSLDGLVSITDCRTGNATNTFDLLHRNAVKKIATLPMDSHTFYTCSEDGTVGEIDRRGPTVKTAVKFLGCRGERTEVQGISIPENKPWYMAAGCGDGSVYVLDRRRMPKRVDPGKTGSKSVPYDWHLGALGGDMCTGVSFSREGTDVLANFSGGHVYEFNLSRADKARKEGASAPDTTFVYHGFKTPSFKTQEPDSHMSSLLMQALEDVPPEARDWLLRAAQGKDERGLAEIATLYGSTALWRMIDMISWASRDDGDDGLMTDDSDGSASSPSSSGSGSRGATSDSGPSESISHPSVLGSTESDSDSGEGEGAGAGPLAEEVAPTRLRAGVTPAMIRAARSSHAAAAAAAAAAGGGEAGGEGDEGGGEARRKKRKRGSPADEGEGGAGAAGAGIPPQEGQEGPAPAAAAAGENQEGGAADGGAGPSDSDAGDSSYDGSGSDSEDDSLPSSALEYMFGSEDDSDDSEEGSSGGDEGSDSVGGSETDSEDYDDDEGINPWEDGLEDFLDGVSDEEWEGEPGGPGGPRSNPNLYTRASLVTREYDRMIKEGPRGMEAAYSLEEVGGPNWPDSDPEELERNLTRLHARELATNLAVTLNRGPSGEGQRGVSRQEALTTRAQNAASARRMHRAVHLVSDWLDSAAEKEHLEQLVAPLLVPYMIPGAEGGEAGEGAEGAASAAEGPAAPAAPAQDQNGREPRVGRRAAQEGSKREEGRKEPTAASVAALFRSQSGDDGDDGGGGSEPGSSDSDGSESDSRVEEDAQACYHVLRDGMFHEQECAVCFARFALQGPWMGEEAPAALPYRMCYLGASNVATVKDVTYLGDRDQYVAAGSEGGLMLIWDRRTGRLVNLLDADKRVVNSMRSHPSEPIIASCGIDRTVKAPPKPKAADNAVQQSAAAKPAPTLPSASATTPQPDPSTPPRATGGNASPPNSTAKASPSGTHTPSSGDGASPPRSNAEMSFVTFQNQIQNGSSETSVPKTNGAARPEISLPDFPNLADADAETPSTNLSDGLYHIHPKPMPSTPLPSVPEPEPEPETDPDPGPSPTPSSVDHTPLLLASVASGSVDGVRDALRNDAEVEALGESGLTPLLMACKMEGPAGREMAYALLEAGANPLAADPEAGCQAIHYATVRGDTDLVGALVAAGADANALGTAGPPLVLAAAMGHSSMVAYLIAYLNADLEGRAPDTGLTALMAAIAGGHDRTAGALLTSGCPVDTTDCAGRSVCHWAAINGSLATLRSVLQAGCPVDEADASGNLPIHYASTRGDVDNISELVAWGSPFEENADGMTPIALAIAQGRAEAVAALGLEMPCTSAGETPLLVAAALPDPDQAYIMVGSLLSLGADPNAAELVRGDTALHVACGLNRAGIVTQLLVAGGNKRRRNRLGRTPLYVALEAQAKDAAEAVSGPAALRLTPEGLLIPGALTAAVLAGDTPRAIALLDAGVDPNAMPDGQCAIVAALGCTTNPALVRELVLAGASLEARDPQGYTPLGLAIRSGFSDVVLESLLGVDVEGVGTADPNARQGPVSGWDLPLVMAAAAGRATTVQLLLGHGADPRAMNYAGSDALSAAIASGSAETVEVLALSGSLDGSPAPRASLRKGPSFLARAAAAGHVEVVKLLIDRAAAGAAARNKDKTNNISNTNGNGNNSSSSTKLGALSSAGRARPAAMPGPPQTPHPMARPTPASPSPYHNSKSSAYRTPTKAPPLPLGSLSERSYGLLRTPQPAASPSPAPPTSASRFGRIASAAPAARSPLGPMGTPTHNSAHRTPAVLGTPRRLGPTSTSLNRFTPSSPSLLAEGGAGGPSGPMLDHTALHAACQAGRREVAELLIAAGLPIDGQDAMGSTPMHVAIAHGQTAMVKLLADRGASLTVRNAACQTPLALSIAEGQAELSALLRSLGALF